MQEENKTVDIDTSGPAVDVELPQEKENENVQTDNDTTDVVNAVSESTDTTTSGHLDTDKSNWYRQEFSFGTGGNNIYSFALKLQAESPIKTFVINDISLIYRIKKPK